ncbi:MAG: twin-arginine translocase TatA/TatE family subunit [Candidatus Sumerlaeota bacterium]|nr:twin-arginine translocase TatA/TatE family subunit [Candidatus Sumerlaeota bacterium]
MSPIHWIIILAIVLIIFGPKNIPKLGQMLGSALKEFHHAKDGLSSPDEDKTEAKPPQVKSGDVKSAEVTPESKTPVPKA